LANDYELGDGVLDAYRVLSAADDAVLARALGRDGESFVWCIGSGISREVVPGTGEMILGGLSVLRQRFLDEADDEARGGFFDVLEAAGIDGVAIENELADWADGPAVQALAENYSDAAERLLPRVGGVDALVSDVLQIPRIYGASDLVPDAEHRFAAMLVREGLVDDIVTTNWDALLERAVGQCSEDADIGVVAHPDDLSETRPRMLKIHGCAAATAADSGKYGRYIVVTADQTDEWPRAEAYSRLRDATLTALRERPSLFIGSSARDTDILIAALDIAGVDEPHDVALPRAVFCGSNLSPEQEKFLRRVHGDAFKGEDAARLKEQANVQLWAKEFLGALWLHTVRAKLRLILESGAPPIDADWVLAFDACADMLLEALDARLAGEDPANRWRALCDLLPAAISRPIAKYLQRELPDATTGYMPYKPGTLGRIRDDADYLNRSPHYPIMSLVALVDVATDQGWELGIPVDDPVAHGQLVVRHGGLEVKVFILHDAAYDYVRLIDEGALDEDEAGDVLLMFDRGLIHEGVRVDVLAGGLPNPAAAESPTSMSVESEIIHAGLDFGQAKDLLSERIPMGAV